MPAVRAVTLLIAGYLLGSVSPAYFLGRLLKGIDIREHGDGNAGTVNTYRVLGLLPAVITATFDLGKGLLAMQLCRLAGGSEMMTHLTGLAAIAGHVFPFYLRFRGGQGVATATAMMMYYLASFYLRGWFPPDSLLLLTFCVISFSFITRKGEFVGLVILPLLGIFSLMFVPEIRSLFYILSLIIYILSINLLNLKRQKPLSWQAFQEKNIIGWRLFLRPLAFILPVFYFLTDKPRALTAVGAIALFFLALDLARLLSSRVNLIFFQKVKNVYRWREQKKFSSITIFLMAMFLTILLFERNLAILACSFLTFGDFAGKIFGVAFGRHRLFQKTIEGSLAHFNACLISAYILSHFLGTSPPVWIAGSAASSIFELLPLGVDDNFTVALLSASVMSLFQVF